ncbi:anion exchange protein 3 [Trichonephila clavipes]|uniref:Anion exchange protein 3 n=1 Tax=Trichonephila clavipes TaxID=2585209 RepID=A0A8X7BKW9_TRICX|nr:anion exchange protein 3 [Trichonephila clavipes]
MYGLQQRSPKWWSSKQKEKNDWEDEELDEEMEEIFHPASDHFSIADLTSEKIVEVIPHFDENDYELHRRESFQYHQPLRKLYHKHRKSSHRKNSVDHHSSVSKTNKEHPSSPPQEKEEPSEDEPLLSTSETTKHEEPNTLVVVPKNEDDKVQFYVGSSSSLENTTNLPSESIVKGKVPLKSVLKVSNDIALSGLSSSRDQPRSSQASQEETTLQEGPTDIATCKTVEEAAAEIIDSMKHKVKFMLGEESREDLQKTPSERESARTNRHRQSRRHSVKRKHHGFNIDAKCYTEVLEPEEAETLQICDIDDMASHRFDDPKGMRRHKVKDIKDRNGVSTYSIKKDELGAITFPYMKKVFDHDPHELFVELHELKQYEYTDSLEWRQTARWIKYEEDVELGPDKWGKPHVPPLSFHSLLRLRHCLDSGGVLLDLEEKDLMGISKRIVDCLIQTDQINSDQKEAVLRALMLRHRHVNEKMLPALRRNSSGYGNLNLLSHDKNRSPMFLKSLKIKQENDALHSQNNEELSIPPETVILMPSDNNLNNIDILPASKRKSVTYDKHLENIQGIQRRVPENSEGAAVLVGQLDDLDQPAAVFIRLAEGRHMPHFLEIPIKVRFLFVLLGPSDSILDYHEIGRAIGALMSNENFHTAAYRAKSKKDLLHAINNFLDTSTVVPPGKWEKQSLLPIDEIRRKSLVPPRKRKDEPPKEEPDKLVYDPLQRKGKLFAGFVQDIRNRYPWYGTDFVDGLNLQCLASVIFIYFASVSGAVAFGGLLGQPLIIIGTTAPLVLIDETLYKIFVENPLLPTYCNETSINSSLLGDDFIPHSIPQPNTALLSTILMIGTFYIAYFLRHFRNSKFLGRSARRALGDFGVPIGLFIMVLIDYFIPNTYTEKLSVPEGFSPSTDRDWGIIPYPVTVWEVALAAVGGLLVFILLFMETQICELIISKKKLKKGSGFHVDMVVVGVLNMLNGFIGCPWQCAAAVRSITHTSSLIVLSKTHAPGETPHIIEVKEQRLTNLLVSSLIGLSMFMTPLLRQVPQATLFGVFLYMGISALSGIHLYERFLLIFMPTKHHPDFNFVRKVRTSKMHLYTLIQIFCIAILWVIKMYATIAFPFALLSMILIHFQIKRLFTEEEIKALDEEGEGSSEEEDEPDFYEQVVV